MSSAERHAEFLADRLRLLGMSVELAPGASSAEGVLQLAPTPFETLGRSLVLVRARFYTLGHNRLKFFDPRLLRSARAGRRALHLGRGRVRLRRAWATQMRALSEALTWLSGCKLTQLVTGGAPALRRQQAGRSVRAPREVLCQQRRLARDPSASPGAAALRSLPSLERQQLALSISSAVAQRARHAREAAPLGS